MLLGAFVSSWCIYKSVFWGCDIDESYAISQAYRLVRGDHLFKQMWEVHQTSSIFLAPFIYLWRQINGTAIGMVVFIRIVGTVIQLLFSIILFLSMKEYLNVIQRYLIALLFLNFTPKYNQVLDFTFLEYIFTVGIIICFLYYFISRKREWWILIGVFQACAILAYPQVIAIMPVQFIVMAYCVIKKRINIKEFIYYWLSLVVCGMIFGLYVLLYIPISELVQNLPLILSDGAHKTSFFDRVLLLLPEMCEYAIPLIIGIIIFEMVMLCLSKMNIFYLKKKVIIIFVLLNIMYSVIPIWLKKYKGICHLDLAYPIIFAFGALMYLNIRYKNKYKHKELTIVVIFLSLAFLCCCFASNMSIYANAGTLLPVVVLQWIRYMEVDWSFDTNHVSQTTHMDKTNIIIPFLVFLFFIIGARATLIRFTSVQPKTIFEKYYTIAVGPAKGIHVTKEEHIKYHARLQAVCENVTAEDSLLIFGSDTYYYFFTGSAVSAPTTISTPVYDENIMTYYNKYPSKIPSIIIIDKYNQSLEKMLKVPVFGKWVQDNYDILNAKDYPFDLVIFRKSR